jgi:hypothetical protein
MVQATNGLNVSTVTDAKSLTCSVCDKPMEFEDTDKDKDPALEGLAVATHCKTRHFIRSIGYRIETAPTPESGPYPPRKTSAAEKEEVKPRATISTSTSKGISRR